MGGEQACSTAFRAVDDSLCHCFFEVEGSTAVREEKVTTVNQRGTQKKSPPNRSPQRSKKPGMVKIKGLLQGRLTKIGDKDKNK